MYLSKYGEARHIYIPIPKAGSANHAVGADWTPATGDVKISKDGGGAANVTNLPTAIAMGNSAVWDFHLTATEMQAGHVLVTVADSVTKAVDDTAFGIETYGHTSSQHAFDLDKTHGLIWSGTAQSVGATSMTTDAAAAFPADVLIGATVVLTNGANAGARGVITDNDASDGLTIGGGWSGGVTPSGTPTFEIIGSAAGASLDDIASAVWASVTRTLTAATNITSTGGTTVPQTGDAFARLGAPAGASVSADILVLDNLVDDLETRLGNPTNMGSGTTIAANLADIESQTDDIGIAGAGLTAVPWNAAWDAEVQSEMQDALDAVIADSVPADGSRPSISQALYMLVQFMLERQVVGTTVNVMKPDGSTVLFTLLLNSALSPTTITRQT